jgi:hypothetical protein
MIAGHHSQANDETVPCNGKSISRALKPDGKFVGGLACLYGKKRCFSALLLKNLDLLIRLVGDPDNKITGGPDIRVLKIF